EKFEVIASVRSLVDKIVIYPRNDPQGRDLELVGQLAALLDTHKLSNRTSMRNVVAEDGFEPPTRVLDDLAMERLDYMRTSLETDATDPPGLALVRAPVGLLSQQTG